MAQQNDTIKRNDSVASKVVKTPLPAGFPACGGPASVDCNDYDDEGNIIHLTQQNQRDLVDIEKIMARVERGEKIELKRGEYRDLVGLDYGALLNKVARARELFEELPVAVRDKYNHDVGSFLSAIEFESDRKFMESHGVNFELPALQKAEAASKTASSGAKAPSSGEAALKGGGAGESNT